MAIDLGPDGDADTTLLDIASSAGDVAADEAMEDVAVDDVAGRTVSDGGEGVYSFMGRSISSALERELRDFVDMHSDGLKVAWPLGWDFRRAVQYLDRR